MFRLLDTSASALTAQRLRMDVISSNIANIETTRAQMVDGEWVPYRRKMVEFSPKGASFQSMLSQMLQGDVRSAPSGVRVTQIAEDLSPFKQVYDPNHPDANEEGYVLLPNVDISKEMVDLLTATRAYEANVTAFNAGKTIAMKALEIGR